MTILPSCENLSANSDFVRRFPPRLESIDRSSTVYAINDGSVGLSNNGAQRQQMSQKVWKTQKSLRQNFRSAASRGTYYEKWVRMFLGKKEDLPSDTEIETEEKAFSPSLFPYSHLALVQ